MAKVIENCTTDDNVFSHRAESDRVKIQKEKMYKIEDSVFSGKFKIQPNHQRAYDLFYRGKTYSEIGEELGVCPRVAKNYKYKAEKKRKEFIKVLK